MPASFDGKLVVAISSRALFDLEESNRVFEEQGVNAYYRYQLEHENEVLAPGIAFALVRKLLRLNALAPAQPRVEVILLSRNTADTGMRIMNSIEHYELDISLDHFIRLPDVALGHAGQFVSIDCIRHSRVSEESAFDRGCVKTQFYFEFGGLPTNTQPEIIEYSAFWKADVLRAGSVLRFYTASTRSGHSSAIIFLRRQRLLRRPSRCGPLRFASAKYRWANTLSTASFEFLRSLQPWRTLKAQ